MTESSTSSNHALATRGNLYRAAIVGAASLKGKEIAEMLNERNFPAVDVRLLDDDLAIVDTGQGEEEVSVALVTAGVGDEILVHAKEAIAVVPEASQ